MENTTTFKRYDRVVLLNNGRHEGTIQEVHCGILAGSYTVRIWHGLRCVGDVNEWGSNMQLVSFDDSPEASEQEVR